MALQRYWPFVRGIHRWPVDSPHKGHWRGAFMVSLICFWINGWENNRKAGDLRRYRAHYDVIVMMMTSSNRNSSAVTGEFPSQRPMTRSFDVFFNLLLDKRLSKQSWGWWFETPSRSLWRHCNEEREKTPPHTRGVWLRSCAVMKFTVYIMRFSTVSVTDFIQINNWQQILSFHQV